MKMYALRYRTWASPGSSSAVVKTSYIRRARGYRGIMSHLVDSLEHATLYPKRAQAAQVQRHSKFPLTVIIVDVITKEIEQSE